MQLQFPQLRCIASKILQKILQIEMSAGKSSYCLDLKSPISVYELFIRQGYSQFTRVPFRQCMYWWYSMLQILNQYIGTYVDMFVLAGIFFSLNHRIIERFRLEVTL